MITATPAHRNSPRKGGIFYLALALLLATASGAQAQTPVKSPKRGMAYGYNSAADLQVLAPGLSWWYNWSSIPDAGAASVYQGLNVDYAPMQWNGSLNNTTVTTAALASRIPAGAQALLGFNEPNFTSQANMTPSQAAALWPVLEAVAQQKNLMLISPALNYCGSCVVENGVTMNSPVKWLDAFFAAYPTARVDAIAVHTYVCQEKYLRDKINELRKYNKPIWLTEFACGDFTPSSGITLALQQKYMLDAVNYLEKDPVIGRYAWFSGRNGQIPNINLLAPASGQLTALGQEYVTLPVGWEPGKLVPVSASATSQESATLSAANAVDTDINTRWSSAFADPQAITLDYGTSRTISRVLLTWQNSYAVDYTVEASNDGLTWTNLMTVVNSDGGVDDLTGLNGHGRYLRITGTRRATTFGYSLWEIEAFGPSAALATTAAKPQDAPTLFPNPATNQATVSWQATASGPGRWYLTNALGQVVRHETLTEKPGPNTLSLDLSPYPAGSYVLTLEGTSRAQQHVRLLKTN
ncbi:hypothetical protein GCM10028822_25970 [Hymenobacter terrigena]